MCHFSSYVILLSFFFRFTQSARILDISPIYSKSHHSIHEAITKYLTDRGHETTLISYFRTKQNSPNYKEVVLGGSLNFVDNLSIEETEKLDGFWQLLKLREHIENSTCHEVFNSNYIRKLMNSKEAKIDVIIAESYETLCYHLLAHALNVPIILLAPSSLIPGADYFAGNPNNPSIVPLLGIPFTTRMNFSQRLRNAVEFTVVYWYRAYVSNNQIGTMAKNYFNMEPPQDETLRRRTALILNNNHPSFLGRPKSLNVIDIAGLHIQAPKKLPQDLQEFVEQSAHGVILFSLGTAIKASSMSTEKIKIITEVFSELPQMILWKVDDLNLIRSQVPPNVKLVKWLPQRDLLEHPKVVAFISHCGLFSVLEAIHTATPVIGIPVWVDQFQNAKILLEKDAGVYVDYRNLDKDTLLWAINETLTPKYQENMRKLSHIFKNRPMSPADEAMYWIEYVIKHRGAPHLRCTAADMPLYQYLLLDVFFVLLVITLSILYILKRFSKLAVICFSCERKRANSIKYKCS